MTYIVVSSNEIVKAEMERPNKFAYSPHGYSHALNVFEKHCLSLPRIPIEGKHDWEVWQSVEKGKDFIFIERCCVEFHVLGVSECESSDDDDNPCKCSVAIPIQPTPEPLKIKNMTITEKKQPRFGVNDDVYILDNEIYDTPKWIHGVVEEVGEETILVKWDDLTDPTEYQISDMPDIRHREPTPEGEKVEEDYRKSIEGNYVFDSGKWRATYAGDILLIHKRELLTNDNTHEKI